jgi:HSP20 family molecular chaperone IbpA
MFFLSDLLSFDDTHYRFSRPMLEREGWYSLEKDGKLLLLLNVLGVDKKDIKLDVKSYDNNKQLISVNGTTKNEKFDKDFSINMNIIVGKPMENLEWDVENGFLTAEITFQEPVKPSVNIVRK